MAAYRLFVCLFVLFVCLFCFMGTYCRGYFGLLCVEYVVYRHMCIYTRRQTVYEQKRYTTHTRTRTCIMRDKEYIISHWQTDGRTEKSTNRQQDKQTDKYRYIHARAQTHARSAGVCLYWCWHPDWAIMTDCEAWSRLDSLPDSFLCLILITSVAV